MSESLPSSTTSPPHHPTTRRILIATDAWHPQVNGVVRTLGYLARESKQFDVDIAFLGPAEFRTVPLPGYPEIRLALATRREVECHLDRMTPDAIHIATEGPIGHAVRRFCLARQVPFTTSFHTRFPDYLAERMPAAGCWTAAAAWRWLRWFHAPAAAVLAATPTLAGELAMRGFANVKLWPRGVDPDLFRPRNSTLALPRPIFLTVGRVAVEKNIDAFLSLDLPGSKVVVGEGPARAALTRRYPQAVFLGTRQGEALAQIYAAADVFVFPSRTDTFGLVLLEALASGLPVAAYPVSAPRDVIGEMPVGALDQDLRRACLCALDLSRSECRAFALRSTWEASARSFVTHVADAVGYSFAVAA
jgi:glycosyltransferase involved in cell wall biosynthesis